MKRIAIMLIMIMAVISAVYGAWSDKQWYSYQPKNGIVNIHETFTNIPAATTDFYRVCTTVMSTATLVSYGTSWYLSNGDFSNSVYGRNLVAKADFSTGIATANVSMTLTIYGWNMQGEETSETLIVTTNTAIGNRAWMCIATMTVTGATASNCATNIGFAIGVGVKIGLSNAPLPANVNRMKVIENGSVSTNYTINTTYNTITFNESPDGSKDYDVWYRSRGK